MSKRIGIYSGSFNPVHAGHISFALQAIDTAKLDKIYFLPERYRKGKLDMAHFGHRVAMLRQAIRPYSRLGLIESSEVTFTVDKSLPKLENRFKGDQLVFLVGSDVLVNLPNWPNAARLLSSSELVVGIREGQQQITITSLVTLKPQPKQLYLINSFAPKVSSTQIRAALREDIETEGILPSVRRYSNKNWLYISLA